MQNARTSQDLAIQHSFLFPSLSVVFVQESVTVLGTRHGEDGFQMMLLTRLSLLHFELLGHHVTRVQERRDGLTSETVAAGNRLGQEVKG